MVALPRTAMMSKPSAFMMLGDQPSKISAAAAMCSPGQRQFALRESGCHCL